MAYFFSPLGNTQVIDANGDPLVGGTIETYLAGTSTPETTYTDDTGGTPQGVVMTLNSLGYPTNGPVWLLGGVPLKFIIKNAAGVTQSTFDDVSGIGDTNAIPDQFPFLAGTPTYISPTSFSLVGDKTNDAQVGRRIRSINSGGTVYSTITASAFSAGVTTVTVSNTSGVLDSGLSQVSYALLTATNDSLPRGIFPTIPEIAGQLFGLTMSTAGSSATMSVAAGVCTNSTSAAVMTLASSIAKTTSAWAVGTGDGGLDTGSIANSTTYHFYVIRRPDTGVVDVIFSTSASAPTLPANYTQYRLIGSWTTNGSAQWTKIIQDGDLFMLDTPVLDVATGTPGAAAFSASLPSLPNGRRLKAIVCVSIIDTASTDQAYISDLSTADLAPSGIAAPGITVRSYAANATGIATVHVMTSTARAIRARVQTGAATCTIRFITLGWVDTRGRDA